MGIGPHNITIRFYKTSAEQLSEKEIILKKILNNCRERQGAYTFDVSNICNICSMTYPDLLLYLYKLQEQKEISYETKDEGIFVKINKKNCINNVTKNILNFLYELNNNLIHKKILKLNCVYILLRKYSVTNNNVFFTENKNIQIKSLDFFGNYENYNKEIKKKINSYFELNNPEKNYEIIDDLYAGDKTEKNILLPIIQFETQKEKNNFVKDLKELIKDFLKHDMNICCNDVLFVLFGYFRKGSGIKSYMSHKMWNKYNNYDFEKLFEIVDSELKSVKIELINEDNKQLGSKSLKI